MIAAFSILALVYLTPELQTMSQLDFEIILPETISRFVPIGLKGLILAGLLAAFMGTFAAVVNSAPAYIVNDLLKNNLLPNKEEKTYVKYGYIVSILIVGIGMLFGVYASSLNTITLWLTSSLYGGYTAANVLKWVWWRFNGQGYFWGMVSGLVASTVKLFFFGEIIDIYFFPIIFLSSILGCILGTFLSRPDDFEILKSFYKNVRPWGFWTPILKEVQKENPSFKPNLSFKKDMFNVIIGIVWQMTLVVWPIYFLIKKWDHFIITIIILIITTATLKYSWYNPLKSKENNE